MAKRTFEEIRNKILLGLVHGQTTVNSLAKKVDINWRTVDHHLIYLIGKGYAKYCFESSYVKIVEITEKGKEVAEAVSQLSKK